MFRCLNQNQVLVSILVGKYVADLVLQKTHLSHKYVEFEERVVVLLLLQRLVFVLTFSIPYYLCFLTKGKFAAAHAEMPSFNTNTRLKPCFAKSVAEAGAETPLISTNTMAFSLCCSILPMF